MNKKLPAFTVLEFSIGMILTAIIVSLGYSAMGIFTHKTIQNAKSLNWPEEVATFQYLIEQDFVKGYRVLFKENVVEVWNENKNIEVEYVFEDEGLLRKWGGIVDTLPFSKCMKSAFYKGLDVDNGFVDAVLLELQYDNKSVSLIGRKEYSAMDHIELSKK